MVNESSPSANIILSRFNVNDTRDCPLPKIDPWHPTIKSYLNPKQNPRKNCKPTYRQRSTVDNNGILHVAVEDGIKNETCSYRCLLPDTMRTLKFANWTTIHVFKKTRVDCDVFEVQCASGDNVTYQFLHNHIVEQS